MKLFRIMLLVMSFVVSPLTQASPDSTDNYEFQQNRMKPISGSVEDYDFQQERMKLTPDSVIVISAFDREDHITAYTYSGVRLWNAPFHAKILSWQIAGDYVFIFSKDRKGTKTYITCLDRRSGSMIWQKP